MKIKKHNPRLSTYTLTLNGLPVDFTVTNLTTWGFSWKLSPDSDADVLPAFELGFNEGMSDDQEELVKDLKSVITDLEILNHNG